MLKNQNRSHGSRSASPSSPEDRRVNPFSGSPLPIPIDGWNLRASDIFRERPLANHLERNAGWIQATSRTSNQIEDTLFPSYSLGGMQAEEVRSLLNRALWDAGYSPNHEGSNPIWTWTEGI